MRVDIHGHIFTLRTILNREAIRVIGQRLRDLEVDLPGALPDDLAFPGWFVDAVEGLLDDQLNRPEYLDERRLLKLLIQKLTGINSFNQWISDRLPSDPVAVRIRGSLDDLPAEVLSQMLTQIANKHPGDGVAGKIINIIQTLRVAMQPTITHVADSILEGTSPDDVLVALMMDIYHHPESARDRRTYRRHILETEEAALQRPGRILPFFGVHPDRPSHFDHLREAVEKRGFVGVKLYPSLGYSVDSLTMRRVYDYCIEKELPVLLHCGHGGFFRDEQKKQLCDPAQWNDVLSDPKYENELKVCFAHFGGWEALGLENALGKNFPFRPDQKPEDNWAVKIRDFMVKYPNVYTDLAKHVAMFADQNHATTYFKTAKALLDDAQIGERILYGTDAWLLRLDMPFAQYRAKWEQEAGKVAPDLLDRLSTEGSMRFLGMPVGAQAPAANIDRYIEYMRTRRARVGDEPAQWLKDAVGDPFHVDRDAPLWNRRHVPARLTYAFLGDMLTKRDQERGWRAAGDIKLSRLEYFDRSAPDFSTKCRALARQLVGVMKKRKQPFSPGNDADTVFHQFTGIFADGDLRMCDVAAALDIAYEFPEPTT